MGLFFRVIEYVLAGTCLCSLNFIVLCVLGIFRNLPGIFDFLRRVLVGFLRLSFRFYQPVLARLGPFALQNAGIDLLGQRARIVASAIFSLALYLIVCLVIGWHITILGVGMSICHGFLVGFIWDESNQADGIRLGERLE